MSIPISNLSKTAVKNLRGRLQRTLLALFGIAIGIGSVTALISTGSIAREESLRQFETLGTDLLAVFGFIRTAGEGGASRTQIGLSRENVAGLVGLLSVEHVAPYMVYSETLETARERFRIQIVGTTASMRDLADYQIESGRFISPLDGNRPFAVIGAEVARQLEELGRDSVVGSRLKLKGALFTIIGTLKPARRGPSSIRPNETAFIPIGHAQRTLGTKELTGTILRMHPGIHYLTATSEIESYLSRTAPHLDVRVDSPVAIIEQMDAQMRLFAILLGAVGGIALIVGGFGVMNAMLASVSEQRLEIGIRRALGAKRGDIQLQVLVESSILCLAGGGIGFLLGVLATLTISLVAGWQWQFSWGALLLGMATAATVGVFFGYYPARQASRLDPIVALRMN